MKKYKKEKLAKEILKGLMVGGFIIAAAALPGLPHVMKMFKARNATERYRIKRALDGLRQKKLVTTTYKNNKEIIEITEHGKKRVLKYDFDALHIEKRAPWDKRWRIVTFDIPNTKKHARNSLNMKLKEVGFLPLQKSLFISPYEARDVVNFIGKHFMVRKNINYIVAQTIDGEALLKKKFGV